MRGLDKNRALLLAPLIAVMGAFFTLPLLLIVAYSFLAAGDYGGVEWRLSLDAYVQVLFERDFDGIWQFSPAYLEVFARSFNLSALCTALCLIIGFPIAHYMASLPLQRRNMWVMLVTIPFWTNLLVRTYAWMLVLRTDGLVNNLLMHLGLIAVPLDLLYNSFAVCLGLVYSYLPFMILPVYASLERMDLRLQDAASDLYAGKWQRLVHVTLPLARPGIVAGSVLVFIPAIGSYLAADLLGGGKQMMIGNLIALQFGFSRNWPFGAALSVILMLIVLVGMRMMRREEAA